MLSGKQIYIRASDRTVLAARCIAIVLLVSSNGCHDFFRSSVAITRQDFGSSPKLFWHGGTRFIFQSKLNTLLHNQDSIEFSFYSTLQCSEDTLPWLFTFVCLRWWEKLWLSLPPLSFYWWVLWMILEIRKYKRILHDISLKGIYNKKKQPQVNWSDQVVWYSLWYSQGVIYKDLIIPMGNYSKQPN